MASKSAHRLLLHCQIPDSLHRPISKLPSLAVPEIDAAAAGRDYVRLPPDQDIPLTPRVRRLIDTPPFRHLQSVTQLGLVACVYPGATHSRREHSMGVYAAAIGLLQRLVHDEAFARRYADNRAIDAFVLASLLHDVGHYPFCHPVEDMRLTSSDGREKIVSHERRAAALLDSPPLRECFHRDWRCDIADVMAIVTPSPLPDGDTASSSPSSSAAPAAALRFFSTCLSGPIDVDKIDYLRRDSLHAGVPYGRNFDPGRLLSAVRPHPHRDRLALDTKGRTAGEMMVFGRYVMFSEVYWHHAVRSATAMLQRSLFDLIHAPGEARIDLQQMATLSEPEWIDTLRTAARRYDKEIAESQRDHRTGGIVRLVEGLFGPQRQLYKRLVEFNIAGDAALHQTLAHRPYWYLVEVARQFAERLSRRLARPLPAGAVLIDAPPMKLEVDINIDVLGTGDRVARLGDVSPVAQVLANHQFDHHVKQVRVFVPAHLRDELLASTDFSVTNLLRETLATTDATLA